MRLEHTMLVALTLASLTGCGTTSAVRYVYQDRDFGVVGMPENTDRWPSRYRSRAEDLMAAHFPEGHEIVRAEEVVEGSRTLTLGGTSTAELAPELPLELLKIAKLGHTATRSQSDSLKIKECRIIYRRANRPVLPEAAAFADRAELTPTQYIDPNAEARQEAEEPAGPPAPAEAATSAEEKAPSDATK